MLRHDRLIQEHIHDPFRPRLKLAEPTVCRDCGAVFLKGRWQWMKPLPPDARLGSCQACRRIRERYPAGVVTLSGAFVGARKDELLHLARRVEREEKRNHPLHRILGVSERAGALIIETTDIHLPRRLGEAVRNAYKGRLDYHYDEGSSFLRVSWSREGV